MEPITEAEKREGISALVVYGSNIASSLFRPLVKVGEKTLNIGNPVMAGVYGGLHFISLVSKKVRTNPLVRLARVGGTLWYVGNSIADTIHVAGGETQYILKGIFDVSMTYQLIRESISGYRYVLEDDFVNDFKWIYDKLSDIGVSRTSPTLEEKLEMEGKTPSEMKAPHEI